MVSIPLSGVANRGVMTAVDDSSRRAVLAGLSAVAGGSVAGCLGGSKDRLTIAVGPVGSRSHRAGQTLAVAADRHSETLAVTTTTIEGQVERLYALNRGEIDAAAADNTTLYRASEAIGAFAADPVGGLPHQGFGYGWRDHYWLAAADIDSTAGLAGVDSDGGMGAVYPGQPGRPGRLVTEQLLRAAGRWGPVPVDNRPREAVPVAVGRGEIGAVAAVETDGRLAPWCRRLDEAAGDRLTAVPVGEAFAEAIDTAPNAVATAVEPTGWRTATLPASADGWRVPSQWLFDPAVEGRVVAELRSLAREHAGLVERVDAPPSDETASAVAAAVMPSLPIHDGVVDTEAGT